MDHDYIIRGFGSLFKNRLVYIWMDYTTYGCLFGGADGFGEVDEPVAFDGEPQFTDSDCDFVAEGSSRSAYDYALDRAVVDGFKTIEEEAILKLIADGTDKY